VSQEFKIIISLLLLLILAPLSQSAKKIINTPFLQEYHVPFSIAEKAGANDVRAIAVDRQNQVWAATRAGVFRLNPDSKQWQELMSQEQAGPVFDLSLAPDGTVWLAGWNGIYRADSNSKALTRIEKIDVPISAICTTENDGLALGPDGMFRMNQGQWNPLALNISKNIRDIKSDGNGGYWIATGMGLYHFSQNELVLYQTTDELLSADQYGVEYAHDGSLWIGGLGGITIYQNGRRTVQFTPENGLPSVNIQCVTRGPDQTMWVGTREGIARFEGKGWAWRSNRRWLVNDDVRDIAFDVQCTAWIATRNGVSAIKRRQMTFTEKAAYFHRICEQRHVREPGLVEKCRLKVPGDTTTWEPRDDDNDGQYTSMYLAMESFRYATTHSPVAKANARRAFEALKYLQEVTGTAGFVARTVIPVDWKQMADPNRSFSPQQWANEHVHDPRYKKVEQRWRPSGDGKWLWKGDTSSDEITGHLFGYLFYYDLVADQAEKKRVQAHVCRIVDYIIEGGYVLKDIDGEHTRWGVWSPEKLNRDPDWRTERGVNSVEILSYLKLAFHTSGAKRYQKEYQKLLYEQGYLQNIQEPKTLNPSWRTHIDDELLALAFPCLLFHEQDPTLRQVYLNSVEQWYAAVKNDHSPYFEFTYYALTGKCPRLAEAVDFLRNAPLDLVRWRMDNSRREDIKLVRQPEMENIQTSKLLLPAEICIMRWDNNPWNAIQGDGGHTESDGVYWLLPYWMGRYYGLITN